MVTALEAYAQTIGRFDKGIPYRLATRSDDFLAFAIGFEGESFSTVLSHMGVTDEVLTAHRGVEHSTLVPMVKGLEIQYNLGKRKARLV